MVDEEKGVG